METKKTYPPKLPHRFFRWYCHPKLLKYIEGDLLEMYEETREKSGKRKADFKFILDVILLFRPGIIRPAEGTQNLNTYGMYKSYFKVGWRNLVRNKGYSTINIGGLAIGMMVAILNGLWIWHEFSYNKYFEHYDQIAQIAETGLDLERGGSWTGTTMTYPLSTELIEKYSKQFDHITRTSMWSEKIVSAGEIKIGVTGLYADKNAPELFSFKMLRGSRNGLSEKYSVMISESLAVSLFGSVDPINRPVRINNKTDVIVTGVFEDFPQNTEFYTLKFFAPWDQYLSENPWIAQRAMTDWRNHFIRIYVKIPDGKSFPFVREQIRSALQFDPADREQAIKQKRELQLYPMSDWHLYPTWQRDGSLDPITMLTLVGIIGAFVLALACINFINLSTARAEKRAKEVGIRKTIGSIRSQLISQFFSESFLIVLISFVLALALTAFVLPGFNDMATKNITMPWTNTWFWLASGVFIFITAILAGVYPALYLSSFNPIKALKGTFRVGRLSSVPRQVLVVFQFSISVILIVGTAVVYQQIQFAKNRPVGYEREGLIMMRKRSDDFKGKYEVLRNELKNSGAVLEVSEAMGPVTDVYSGNNGWDWKGRDPNIDEGFATLSVSHLHGKTVGWQFVQGHDFDLNNLADSTGLVINESALRFMKLENPIGEPVVWTWWADKSRVLNYKIIGVIKDLVMESPYAPSEPTMFYLKGHNGRPSWIHMRINPAMSASEALPKIESVFKKVVPAAPFDYVFADDEYAKKFGKEERIGNIATVFAVLAIFISCLGLLGLASFVAEARTKEIGIRKVLGATVAGLWKMLSKDFVWLVLIACIVATPLAYLLMEKWLNKFSYHINISMWVFIGTAAGAIAVTLLTISYQAIKAAMMNPVKSLRSE